MLCYLGTKVCSSAAIGQVALRIVAFIFNFPVCDELKHQKGTWKYFMFLECSLEVEFLFMTNVKSSDDNGNVLI